MKRILFFAIFILAFTTINAQGYKHSAGIRAAWISPGIEYSYYTADNHSLRALLSTRGRGVQLHLLTEFYEYDLFSFSPQLVFYYGGGVHFGTESWNKSVTEGNQIYTKTKSSFLAGLDGVAGVDYIFYEVPVKIGLEVKPFFDVFGRYGFRVKLPDFALRVNYLF